MVGQETDRRGWRGALQAQAEIYMTRTSTFDTLDAAAKRFNRLKNAFDKFAQLCEPEAGTDQPAGTTMTIDLQLERHRFELNFLGRTLRFAWFARLSGPDAFTGHVICSTPSIVDEKKSVEVGRFDFDTRGNTPYVPAGVMDDDDEEEEALNIQNDSDAIYILGALFLRALQSTS